MHACSYHNPHRPNLNMPNYFFFFFLVNTCQTTSPLKMILFHKIFHDNRKFMLSSFKLSLYWVCVFWNLCLSSTNNNRLFHSMPNICTIFQLKKMLVDKSLFEEGSYVHNNFITNHRWIIVIGSNLNLTLKLFFCLNNNNQ